MNANIPPQEPVTVVVTTKNTMSLTLGITAIVVGILSLLLGWIPFLGLLALPGAILGLILSAIGLIVAMVKNGKGMGMPLLGGGICFAAFILPILSTGGASAAISNAVNQESNQPANASASNPENQNNTVEKTKSEYIQQHLVLYDVDARYMDSALDGKIPGILFKLKNTGNRSLDFVKVTIVFKDAQGNAIHEEDYYPVNVSEFSVDDDKPLKPGYVWQMESGKFFAAKSAPSEWKEGSVDAKISDIRFSKD